MIDWPALRRAAAQMKAFPQYVYAGAYVLAAERARASAEAEFEHACVGMAAVSGMPLTWCRVVALGAYAENIPQAVASPSRALTPPEIARRMADACAIGRCELEDPWRTTEALRWSFPYQGYRWWL